MEELKTHILKTLSKYNVPEPLHFYDEVNGKKFINFIWINENENVTGVSLMIFDDDSSLVCVSDHISNTYKNTSENIEEILHTIITFLNFLNITKVEKF